MKRTSPAIAGGFYTTESTAESSRFATRDLDNVRARIDEIKNDESRSSGEKAAFLKKWRSEVELTSSHHYHNIGNHIRTNREKLATMEPARKSLSTHAAILLAQDLKDAAPAKRSMMVAQDSRYADLLDELPASYFGISEERVAGLKTTAARTAQSVEQRALDDGIRADEEQLNILQGRRDQLLKEIDAFCKDNAGTIEKQDQNAHLYELSKP